MESKPVINETSGIEARGLRNRYVGSLSGRDIGELVRVCGWVSRIREQKTGAPCLEMENRDK